MNNFLMFYAPFIVLIGALVVAFYRRTNGWGSTEAD